MVGWSGLGSVTARERDDDVEWPSGASNLYEAAMPPDSTVSLASFSSSSFELCIPVSLSVSQAQRAPASSLFNSLSGHLKRFNPLWIGLSLAALANNDHLHRKSPPSWDVS